MLPPEIKKATALPPAKVRLEYVEGQTLRQNTRPKA